MGRNRADRKREQQARGQRRIFRDRRGMSVAPPIHPPKPERETSKAKIALKTMDTPISNYLSKIGRKGAQTRWDKLSKEERAREMRRRRRLGIERSHHKTPKE